MNRIGPRMLDAARYVANHPGCAILPVARHVGPHGSTAYRTVHRAIKAGIIRAEAGKGNRYALYPVDCLGSQCSCQDVGGES